MKDFIGTTTMAEIQRAMEFIDKIRSTGKTVYLHCKAGPTINSNKNMTRSRK